MRFAREITALVAAPAIIWVIGWGHDYVFNATIALGILLVATVALGRGVDVLTIATLGGA